MRKATAIFVLLSSIVIYCISSVDELTRRFAVYKVNPGSFLRSDRMKYGDLYRMSSLPNFKVPIHEDSVSILQCNLPNKIDLYAVCDSYVWMFLASSKYFCGVNKFDFANVTYKESLNLKLDSSKKNVLLLELTERNVRVILEDKDYVKRLLKNQPFGNTMAGTPTNDTLRKPKALFGSGSRIFSDVVFNKEINANIQSNAWDLSIFSPLRELKASLNYGLFGILDKDVSMATNSKFLFYTPTIDTTAYYTSSFNRIPDNQLNNLIGSLNTIYSNAKLIGFDKIYLSIIPNPVSMIEPGYGGLKYNDLVNRVQKSPSLQMQCIDVVPVFKQLGNKVYFPSDTHWNIRGAEIWRDMINTELAKMIN